MSTQQNMDSRLWDYIDGLCTDLEKSEVEKLLHADPNWQSKYRELLEVKQLLASSELEEPSMRFTKNVMDEIARAHVAKPTMSYINKNIIYAIAGFFFVVITAGLVYFFATADWSTSASTSSNINLPKIDASPFQNKAMLQAIMFVNLVLGLFLLDRYLRRNKKDHYKEA